MEFRSEGLRRGGPEPVNKQGPDLAQQGSANSRRKLAHVLVREHKMQRELASLGKQGCEYVRRDCLSLVDVDKKRYPRVRRNLSPLHRNELQVRGYQRPQQVRGLLPHPP